MSDRRHRDLRRSLAALAAAHGATVTIAQTRRGHFRASFAMGSGKVADVVMAATPRDWRNEKNNAALVRRLLRREAR